MCPHCERRFTSASNLRTHLRLHADGAILIDGDRLGVTNDLRGGDTDRRAGLVVKGVSGGDVVTRRHLEQLLNVD
jgi:Zinc finger, C2H2 type